MKYLILGAGPAGLTAANRLKELVQHFFDTKLAINLLYEEETDGMF